jgi:hypothetical protein
MTFQPEKAEEVVLMEEQDQFHEVIMNTMQLLVRALETLCEPGTPKHMHMKLSFSFRRSKPIASTCSPQ